MTNTQSMRAREVLAQAFDDADVTGYARHIRSGAANWCWTEPALAAVEAALADSSESQPYARLIELIEDERVNGTPVAIWLDAAGAWRVVGQDKLALATPSTPEAGVEIPAGMKPWLGGDSAPEDWNASGALMMREGCVIDGDQGEPDWRHQWGEGDIIAYTPKPQPQASDSDALRDKVVRHVQSAVRSAERHGNTEGLWLSADQWRFILAALTTHPTPAVAVSTAMIHRAYRAVSGATQVDRGLIVDVLTAAFDGPASEKPEDVERLRALCGANNDLARLNGKHRDEWRAKAVVALEALAPFAEACTISTHDDDDGIDDSLAATRITFGDLRRARAILASETKSMTSRNDKQKTREQIARIIDPTAWRNEDGYMVEMVHADDALAKADAILAALSKEGMR